jgi:hypothetical protein
MKKKKICITIMGIFLLIISSSIPVIGINTEKIIDDQNLETSNGDWHVTIKVKYLGMQDCVDMDGSQLNNHADWYWKIWVSLDDTYTDDEKWEDECPEDKWEYRPNKENTWNIGNAEEVNIRMELYDADDFPNPDDVCDLHGYNPDQRHLELIYNPVTNKLNTLDSGGYKYIDPHIYRFHGAWNDGSTGRGCELVNGGADDDDVELWLQVVDDHRPAKFEIEAEDGAKFYANDVSQCTEPKNFILKNTGTVTGTCTVSLTGENANEFEITEGAGFFTLAAGEEMNVKVKFCPNSKSEKECRIFADGDDSCIDGSKKLTGVMNNKPTWGLGPNGYNIWNIRKEYTLYFHATDKDKDDLWYKVDWGSSLGEEILTYGPYQQDWAESATYTFKEEGKHILQIWAIDEHGGSSPSAEWDVVVVDKRSKTVFWLPDILSGFPILQRLLVF